MPPSGGLAAASGEQRRKPPAHESPTGLRVFHVLEATLGGTGRVVPALARTQAGLGASVGLAYSRERADPPFLSRLPGLAADGVTCVECPMSRAPLPWRDVVSALHLRRIVRSFAPDVLHLHASKAGMLGRLLFGFRRRPVVVYQPHGFAFLRRRGAHAALYRTLERGTARLVDACLVVSQAERNDAVRGPLGWPARIELVPNIVEVEPVDPDRVRAIRAALPMADGELVALYVGMLLPGKLLEDLIRAIPLARAQGAGWRAVVVGDGPRRRTLQALARTLGVDAYIHWPGFQMDAQNWMAAADCLVHPSQFEAFGLSIAEAMTVGRPVIASDIAATRELVVDGVTGMFYPAGQPARLAERLATLGAHPDLRARLGAEGRRTAGRFSAARVAQAHLELYRDLLGTVEP